MAFRLTPHERGFYPLFTRAAENIVVATDLLARLVAADSDARPELAAHVTDAEHVGDDLTHEILVRLNRTFVTPFDREDIYRLASSIDDVVDAVEEAADRIVLYQVGELPPAVADQVAILCRAAECTARAMPGLDHVADLQQYWIDVNSMEDEADAVYRGLLRELFAGPCDTPADLLCLMKTKEVVETLENAADALETVANTVQSIAVKES